MKKLSLFLTALLLIPSLASAEDQKPKKEPAKQQMTQEQVQKVVNRFQQQLQQQTAFKDADALRIMKEAKENDGKLTLDFHEMVKILKKWDKDSIPARFKVLFAERVVAKDKDALALNKKAQEGEGKLQLTPEEMTDLVKKWEAADKEPTSEEK